MNFPLKELFNKFPYQGTVTWIGVRPEKQNPMIALNQVKVLEHNLEGDHYKGKFLSKRHVTFIQQEHINAVASFLGKEVVPELLRRNIVVQGINLLAFKGNKFQVGEAIFEMSGICDPCSKMEQNLGAGGYNAMRGHGGITARIISGGFIKLGDPVSIIS